ncbi:MULTISPECIES: DUF5374 domain-containing protein [Pasteurellaceae]|uniref:DUF5374 domain-containing protein n=1 Tax=Pasteurellaceae TaxID=712 RepID=UPI003562BE48
MMLNLNSTVNYKGMNLLSLLVTLTLFSGIFLSVNQWIATQRQSAVNIYQRYQAIQIAENQRQRLFLGLACQPRVEQNQLTFRISCSPAQVSVRYPAGEIVL